MSAAAQAAPAPYVARWHSDEGFLTAIVVPEPKRLRLVVQGYPVVVRSLPLAEARHLTPLDYPVLRAARKMRAFARNNASSATRHVLDRLAGK